VRLVEDVKHYQLEVLGAICLISLILWLVRLRRRKRVPAAAAANPSRSQQDPP
jgi:hypothetical protein